jgi:EmrB/QacA subfamily drug resistance transporter
VNLQRYNVFHGLTSAEVKALLVLGPGSFVMASTIGTINVGLPAVQDEFGVSLSALKWVSIMGAIMMASMSLCFGRLGDITGRKRIYKLGMLLYCVFSGVAALSPTFAVLIGARVITAMGVAMSISLGIAIGAASARPERRGQVIGVLASFTAAGQLAGPSLGGFALELADWRGVFWANFIVAGLCCIIQWVTLRGEDEKTPQAFDLVGSILLLVGYPALLIGLSMGPRQGWTEPFTLFWFAVAAVGIIVFFAWEMKAREPLFRLKYFTSITFCIAMFTLIVASFVQNPVTLFTPLYMENVLHVSAVDVGLIMMALPISTLVAGPIGGRLADRYDPRVVAAGGMFVTFLAVLVFAQLGVNTNPLVVILPLALIGFGGGFFRPANQVAVFAGVSRSEFGSLSAMLQSVGALAGTLGTTITIAITEARTTENAGTALAEAQQFTFTALLPLLLVSVFVSLLGRSREKKEAPAPVTAASQPQAGDAPAS